MQAISAIFITKIFLFKIIDFHPGPGSQVLTAHFPRLPVRPSSWMQILSSNSDEWKNYLGLSSFAFTAKKSAEYNNNFIFVSRKIFRKIFGINLELRANFRHYVYWSADCSFDSMRIHGDLVCTKSREFTEKTVRKSSGQSENINSNWGIVFMI